MNFEALKSFTSADHNGVADESSSRVATPTQSFNFSNCKLVPAVRERQSVCVCVCVQDESGGVVRHIEHHYFDFCPPLRSCDWVEAAG